MDVTQLVRQATPTNLPPLARGRVFGGSEHPGAAPTAFSEPVYVILPEGSSEHLYGPCKWLAGHGTAKPQPGAACVVGFDEQNQPTIFWWDGIQTEPVPGAESITEAMLKAGAVSESKLASAVQAKLNQGAWTSPETTTAKLEGVSIEARLEANGTLIHYRGNFTAKENIKAEENLLTMPAAVRPTSGRFGVLLNASSGATGRISLEATGVMRYVGTEIGKASVATVEGLEIVK